MVWQAVRADSVGGGWGARYGPAHIRRALDTWRTGILLLVLVVAVLIAAASGFFCVTAIRLLPDANADDSTGYLVVAPVAGLVLVAALRMIGDVVLRGWWRGRRGGPPTLTTAPSGLPATAYLRSRIGLVVPALVAVLFLCFGAGFAVVMIRFTSSWWSLPFVAWGLWGAAYLAPFVLGRVRAGGLYLTANGLEHRFGTVTAFTPWLTMPVPEPHGPFLLPAGRGSRRRSFPWNIAGDPTDAAPRGYVSVPLTYLPTTEDQLLADVAMYTSNPAARPYLGSDRSLEWLARTPDA